MTSNLFNRFGFLPFKNAKFLSIFLCLQPDHLNLDLERPHFEGIDMHRSAEPNKDDTRNRHYENVTYEELQRRNREKYAIKHTGYY